MGLNKPNNIGKRAKAKLQAAHKDAETPTFAHTEIL